jgi:hypothetical protein
VSSEREEERGRDGQGHPTDGEKLRWPTMARRQISLAVACTGREEGAGDSRGVRRGSCMALGGFYRARRGGGATTGQQWPLMAMAAAGCLNAIKGGASLGKTEWRIDGEGKTGALVLLDGGLKEGRGGGCGASGRRRRWMFKTEEGRG